LSGIRLNEPLVHIWKEKRATSQQEVALFSSGIVLSIQTDIGIIRITRPLTIGTSSLAQRYISWCADGTSSPILDVALWRKRLLSSVWWKKTKAWPAAHSTNHMLAGSINLQESDGRIQKNERSVAIVTSQ
jgi:hypothetical protein